MIFTDTLRHPVSTSLWTLGVYKSFCSSSHQRNTVNEFWSFFAKFVEGAGFGEACERDWREHEEFFSKKISVLPKTCAEKEFGKHSQNFVIKQHLGLPR